MPNSSILYKENKDSSEILGTNDVVDETGHSIWTNKEHPYRVENTENQTPDNVVLWKKDDVSGSAIQAQMYNNRNLSAMNFKYTYDKSVGGGFNEWVDMNDSFAEGKANDNTAWSKMGTGNTSTADQTSVGNNNALEIKVPYLSFGTTKFYVEFENDYGFMARFYFQKSSKLNPTVSSVGANNTLTEGEKYIFAANWKQVEGAKNPTYTFTYEEEAEKGNKLTISVDKKETQKVDGKDDPQEKTYTISAHITITLGNEAKSYTNLAQKNDPGAPGKEEFTDPKSTIGPSSVLTGDVADATQEQGIKFDDDSVTWTLAGFDSKFTWSHLWYWDATGEGSAKNIPAQNMLKGATISVRFDIKVTAGEVDYTNNMVDRLDPITVKFNDKQLNQTYSEGSSGTIETDVEDTEIVRMNGIDAYGFSRRNLTIDEYSATGGNGNQDFTSNFNDILIDRVDFYETDGKTWLYSDKRNKRIQCRVERSRLYK